MAALFFQYIAVYNCGNVCQIINKLVNRLPKSVYFCHRGEILPNVVTLSVAHTCDLEPCVSERIFFKKHPLGKVFFLITQKCRGCIIPYTNEKELLHVFRNPRLVVMGEDLQLRGHEFESQKQIVDKTFLYQVVD